MAADEPTSEAEAPGAEEWFGDEQPEGAEADRASAAPEAAADGVHDEPEPEPDARAEAEPAAPDFKDLYLRAAAETENIRKRARRDIDGAHARGVAKLARELLPGLDNLERAIAAAEAQEDEDHHLTKGIRLVQQELLTALTRVGIEQYSPKGETFDPHQHEAISQMPVEGLDTGAIAEVYQAGYRYRDEVLRPAKVVVAA